MYIDKAARKAELKKALIQWLKSMIAPCVIALIILIGVLVIINYRNAGEEAEIIRVNGWEGEQSEFVLENDQLKFVLDAQTTQFSIEVKSTGKVWYSNPVDAASDPVAQTSERGKQFS